MKHRFFNFSVTAAVAVATVIVSQGSGPARAGDVWHKMGVTERVGRPHGAYFGFFGGGAPSPDVGVGGLLSGYAVDTDSAWMLGVEFGYEFNTPYCIRPSLEVELFYLDYDFVATDGFGIARAELDHINLMFNAVVALDLGDNCPCDSLRARLHPYIGAGIGGAHTGAGDNFLDVGTVSVAFADGSSLSFAAQVFGGLEFDLNECFSIYGEYRWLHIADLPGGALSDSDLGMWNTGLKIRY